MNRGINTILVPVDFSKNSELAISKALEFCQEDNDLILHLFYSECTQPGDIIHYISQVLNGVTQQQITGKMKDAATRLGDMKMLIESEKRNVKVLCWVSFGNCAQEEIIKKARQLSVDLIIIGKKSYHSFFPLLNTVKTSKLALATGIPVLIAKPGSINKVIKTVVIPINHKFPMHKIDILTKLWNNAKPHIRLVIFEEENTESSESRQYLLEAFRLLKSLSLNKVNYEVLEEGNKAKALVKYCNKVSADVLIVYPGAETRVGRWLNGQISDLIPSSSKTQILAVCP